MFAAPKGGPRVTDPTHRGIYIIGKLEMTGLENEQEQMESVEEKKHQNGRKTAVMAYPDWSSTIIVIHRIACLD